MPDWFIDLENGSDSNSGDSFAVTLNGTTTVTNGTTTVTRAAGGFTGLAGRKIYFVTTAAGRTLNSITSDTAAVMNATVGAATQTANVGGARKNPTNMTTTTCQGITAGDRVKIMGSASPTSTGITAVFQKYSPTVTLLGSSSVQVNTGESAWTGVTNVTVTQSTTAKQGTYSVSVAIGASFTTGKAAYFDLGSTIDYSAYRILTFWVQQTSGTLMTTANDLSVRLCSDSLGVTAVSTFNVPGIRQPGAAASRLGVWVPMAIDLGSAVSASCRSIAIYVGVDRGAQTFLFDDFRLWSASTSVRVLDTCESAWTASANVTTTTATGKVGTNATSIAVATAFTTGKAAYKALGSTVDLSAYTGVTFWFHLSLGATPTAGQITLRLCSDTVGDVTVDTLSFPSMAGLQTSNWTAITLDKGSALGSSIQSIALYVASDSAAQTFLLDQIVAVSSTPIDLPALYGSSDAQGAGGADTETWHQFREITPSTCVILPYGSAMGSVNGRGFMGADRIDTLWRRPTIWSYWFAATAWSLSTLTGSAGAQFTWSGGWDRTDMSTQSLETWWNVNSSAANGISVTTAATTIEKIAVIGGATAVAFSTTTGIQLNLPAINHANTGFSSSSGAASVSIPFNCYCSVGFTYQSYGTTLNMTESSSHMAGTGGAVLSGSSAHCTVTIGKVANCNGQGMSLGGSSNLIAITECSGNASNGFAFSGQLSRSILYAPTVSGNASYGFTATGNGMDYGNNRFRAVTTGNGVGSVSVGGSTWVFEDSTFNEATVGGGFGTGLGGAMYSSRESSTSTLHRIRGESMLVESDSSVRHTASGIAWRLDVTSASARTAGYPGFIPLGRHYVPAGSSTVKVWLRRTSASLTVSLVCRGRQVAGIESAVSTAMTAAINTWEEVSITIAPTYACYVEFFVEAYGAIASAYADDMTVGGLSVPLDIAAAGIPTFNPAYTFPAAGDVRSGKDVGDGSTTGTLTLPAVGDVRTAKTYGAGGTEYTGTLTLPAAGDVRTTKSYGSGGTEFTGTLTLPAASVVLTSNSYGSGGTEFTGTVTLPAAGDVQLSVTYGASLGTTGTFKVPSVGDVKLGVGYGAGGTEFTGTLTGGGGNTYAAIFC